jgi:polyisoprenoid-binding protein YceI
MKKIIFLSLFFCITLFCMPLFAADTFNIDPAHCVIGFSVSHLGISNVNGQFKETAGSFSYDASAAAPVSDLKVIVKAASVDTAMKDRDDHIRSADFFDVEKFPEVIFQGTKIESKDGALLLSGTLTMHGVTKEIQVPLSISGPVTDPWGNTRIGLSSQFKVNRKDYGIIWNKVLDNGGLLVGEEVSVTISLEAIKKTIKPAA